MQLWPRTLLPQLYKAAQELQLYEDVEGGQVITSKEQLARIATDIVVRADGVCDWCKNPIGKDFCAPGQVYVRESGGLVGVDLGYDVICRDCHSAIYRFIRAKKAKCARTASQSP